MIFSLIGSISAVELSDNDITQNNNDNIQNIKLEEKTNNVENSNDNTENILEETSPKKLNTANSNTIHVSTDGDDFTGDGSKNKPYKTIKQGIDNSNNKSTIYLTEGHFDAQNITIDKTLTIEGKTDKTILDAKHTARIFSMTSSAKLTLTGLTLINGNIINKENGTGGSIYNDGGELTLISCTIKDSYADLNGGAIYNNNTGKLTIINSNIINNSAVQYGGAIYSVGITNIENSFFTENQVTAIDGVGGTIVCGGTAFINNTVFLKNYAIYSAGAILNLGNTTINNCSFLKQTTEYTAGAISNHNYIFINNSIFSEGYSQHYAAAILAPPSEQHIITEVYNTIFEKNYVRAHGAVSNNYPNAELKMENCAIVDNYILTKKGISYGDIALDDNATLLYCWWGQNEISPYYYSPHNASWESWKINASKWLVMEFTSNNGIIKQDVNNILNVNIKHYFDNETKRTYDYNKDINLPLTVKFYTNTRQTIAEVKLVNGSATINYIPENNVETVYAKLNNQIFEINVKEKKESKLIVSDLSKYYKENKDLELKLTDEYNNPLYNKTIKVLLTGKEYNLTTNNNGIVKVPLDLNIGTYTAKISFVDEEYRNQNKNIKITVLKNETSISASNLIKYYKNSDKLIVKLLDNNKKPLKSKTIQIKIAGKTYTKITNSKGIATFTINQKVGTYSVKILFNGDNTYQSSSKTIKVYVKSAKLTTKTKKIHRKSYFAVTIKDKNGKAIKNTKVIFKLNGKTYTKTTNNKGIAKLKINVKIGTYTIKTSFKSTKLYGATVFTNKIKVIK